MSGFGDIVKSNAACTGASLTVESLERMMEQIKKPRPPHYHVIAASAKPGTVTWCADCGCPVRVPEGWGT